MQGKHTIAIHHVMYIKSHKGKIDSGELTLIDI